MFNKDAFLWSTLHDYITMHGTKKNIEILKL